MVLPGFHWQQGQKEGKGNQAMSLKRTIIISTIVHAIVIAGLIVFTGSSKPIIHEPHTAVLTFLPDRLVDQPVISTPSSRSVSESEPQQPQQKTLPPKLQQKPVEERLPTQRQVKPPPPDQKQPNEQQLSDQIKLSLKKPVVRSSNDDSSVAEKSRLSTRLKEELAKSLNEISSLERRVLDWSTTVTVAGAEAGSYADYALYVKMVYERAWKPPAMATEDLPPVRVQITIARDGTVISSKIIEKSGNVALDQSVDDVLRRIKSIGRPFPEGTKEETRTFIINFKVKISDRWE